MTYKSALDLSQQFLFGTYRLGLELLIINGILVCTGQYAVFRLAKAT
jgi:hypothetical protein